MYFFAREHSVDYNRYRFSYGHFCALEAESELDEIYRRGYLPYSGDPAEPRNLFHMARSLRIDLATLKFSKKREYLRRQFGVESLPWQVIDAHDFNRHCTTKWMATVRNWMTARFGQPYLSDERIRYILNKPYGLKILKVHHQGLPFAEILLCCGGEAVHYWFAFYNPEVEGLDSPGKGLLSEFLLWARSQGFRHAYLGTGYGQKSAYKLQGIRPVSFWDGADWNTDLADLKKRWLADC